MDLDWETVIADGRVFQVRSDGSVPPCGDEILTPFAAIKKFAPDRTAILEPARNLGDVTGMLVGLLTAVNQTHRINNTR